jgi:amino acid adenylation domain-containing protein
MSDNSQTDLLQHPGAIAIIGMAGRFPGAPDIPTFWQNLIDGKDTITRFNPADSTAAGANSPDFIAARGVLDDAGLFDADFFGIVPREAERMDPQHRLFLEACSNALEDAGYVSHNYPGEIGLFAGCAMNTYLLANLCKDRAFIDEFTSNYQVGEFQTLTGNDKDFLTTRVAYKLDLRGPVVTVQSACATSLVAICQAAQSLLNFQCDMALAGGASITFPQLRGHIPQEGGLASTDGVCRPFDASAAGTVFGHGVGVILLKRLEDAVRDGDRIAAVIRGFAINNDGAQKAGYMAPGVNGQARVISAAQAMAGVTADSISYVEAHGTGTPLGDPIEFAALTQAFRETTDRSGFCTLGTAKGNVGHLDAAAGVAGVIKTVLSMQHKTLPGLAHFSAPNPELALDGSPFVLSSETKVWESNGPRRAGVSAFGVGGVNAHIVLEEAPAVEKISYSDIVQPICVSARSPKALQSAIANLASHLEANPGDRLSDVAFTLATGRRVFEHRFAFAADSAASAIAQLREAAQRSSFQQTSDARIAFLFSGQGAQFVGMGKALYDFQLAYREAFDQCAAVAQSEFSINLYDLIFTEPSEANAARLQETRFAQPALFATEFALAKLWQSWGIEPESATGHSIGEYVAAVLYGVMSVGDAMRLVCLRGKLMQQMTSGAMLSVPLSEEALAKYLRPEISIAALNSQRASVLSGPIAAIAELEKTFAAEGVAVRRLRTSHAFHSAMMEPMLAEFESEVATIALHKPARPFVSTATGTWITDKEATSPAYWAQQVRKPVRFADAVGTLRENGINVFLEVGPGETLTALTLQQRTKNETFRAIASMPMPRESSPVTCIQAVIANLWVAGAIPDWAAIFAAQAPRRAQLPTYPFERKPHWIEPPALQTSSAHAMERDSQETPTMTPAPMPAATSPSRLLRLQAEISTVFTDLSGIALSPADADLSFLELGFDSLFLTQATLSLQRTFGVKITFRQLMERFSSVATLATHLDSVLPAEAFAPVPAASAPEVQAAVTLPQLPATTGNGTALEALFAQQLATLTNVFTAQMAVLQGAAPVATPVPAIIAPNKTPIHAAAAKQPVVSAVAAAHGTFQPASRTSHELDAAQQKYLTDLIALTEARTPGSKSLTERGRTRLADPRAVAGFRPQWKEMVYPIITDRAQGPRLWDIDGNEYIDIVNGFGCILFGHSPQFVVEAVHKQLETGVAIGPQSPLAIEVAELICELTGNERATFCNTGSEAVMAAIRVARTVTGRDKFVYFTGDYHGTFDEVLIRNTPRGSAPLAPGIPTKNTSNVVVLDYGTDASLDYIRAHADEIAAVLIEPVQTRHPDNKPFNFIRTIREITEQNGIAMVLDEVVTGFRLAPGGIQELLGVRADMCTYGKVIGGGHPIGVLSGKAQYLDALDGGKWHFGDDSAPEVGVTFFAGTFVRHPLAMAAARAVLLHLKSEGAALQQNLNRKTAELAERLDSFFVERGVPARIHHFASWFYWTFPSDVKLATLFYYAMRAKGIHIQEGYPCFLTTAHTDADFKAIEQAFRETIFEMQAANVMPSIKTIAPVAALTASTTLREPAMHELALRKMPERVLLTEPQREIFLAAALNDEANCAFNESLKLTLCGPVRPADLRFALEAVISRHDALRSVVCEDGDCLCIDPVFSGEATLIDLRSETRERQQQILAENIAYEGRTPFDLHQGPLVRSTCFLNSDDELVLLLTAHHIVLDGWSANQLLEEISVVYSKGANVLTELAPLLPFSSYATRQIERSKGGEFAANEQFWVSKFAGRSPRLELPTDRPRPTVKSYRGATLNGNLDRALYEDLKKLSAKNGCSLYVELLSSFQLLLHRLTGQEEVIVGISTAGQSLIEGASLVGHCVNFLPMLSEITPDTTVQNHLLATRSALLNAQDHQEFTYGSLLQKLPLDREPGRLPLIEVQFNLERIGSNVRFDGLEADIQTNPRQFVNTDLFLNVVESPKGLQFTCDYNTDLFDASTIARWMLHWAELLRSEIANPSAKTSELKLLTAAEQSQILNDWNRTAIDFGPFTSLPSIVFHHAALTPNRVAIECAGRQWTYAELAEYATILARRLVHEGLAPGGLVGICIERSLEMAGALIAVMMAGGAYVPLDPRHPRERLATIIADSGIMLLLTGRDPSIDTSVKMLNVTGPQPQHNVPLPQSIAARDLAYVIYTSGSTGKPKGVAIEHAALMNLLHSMQREPGLRADDVLVAVTTLAFDIAALELFLPLLSGAKLVIATDEQVTNGMLLLRLLEDSQATVMQATPGAWRILLEAGWSATHPLQVLCGGEALPRDLADKLLARSANVWNVYGPTETTIWSSANRVTSGTAPLRIGPAIANTQFYILDAAQRLAPIGVAGELCIGGEGLARGYWNRAELTAEKFLPNPFGPGRIYRTGDLGRWHTDGTLELLGRSDFQVKIRGYRIELGEIEAVFAAHPQVREAVVLAHQGPSSVSAQLAAFIDCGEFANNSEHFISALRDMVERALPTYMVPQIIVALRELPRLPNTKVDRKALLRLAAEHASNTPTRRTHTPPANDNERRMVDIWSDVLQLDQVSTTESIFELGADSLAVFRIAARAQREGLPIKPVQIFEYRTVAAICATLMDATQTQKTGVEPSNKRPAKRIIAASRESYRLTR